MQFTRRDFGKLALASVPASMAFGAGINSKFGGVQIGSITYSFRSMNNAEDIIKAYQEIGLGEAELMSNHAEALAGAPAMPQFGRGGGGPPRAMPPAGQPPVAGGPPPNPEGRKGGGGRQMTPEQQAAMQEATAKLASWRTSANADTWKTVRKKWNDAGIEVALLCYNMQDRMKDEEIEYGFLMAQGLGVKAMSTSTTLTMAKRIAPIADKYKILVGYHGHDQTSDPNQTATIESYDTLMAYGKYNGINLDIGHFTASNYDAVAFIQKHHDKITNLHIKDRKKDHGPNTPWGEGDTPIKAVLQTLKKNKYPFPANIEMEYQVPEGSTLIAEMKKCLAFAKDALA